jgi:hypothetical protein
MDVDIARRLVACHGWRWLRCCPWAIVSEGEVLHRGMVREDPAPWVAPLSPHQLPDTDSPALPGLVLHLVRLAWVDPRAHVAPCIDGTWRVWVWSCDGLTRVCEGPSELEALCLALESAPLPAAHA